MPTFTPPRPDEIEDSGFVPPSPDEIEDSGFVPPSPDEIEQPPPDLSKLKLNPYTKVQMETGMRSPDYDPGDFTVALFHQLPRDVGAGLTKAGKVLAAVPKDVGNRMIVGEPEGYELDENGNRIGWPNLRAAVAGEESPSDRLISQKLGKPANFVNAATTGLIESSPRLAAAIADPALGAVAFGLQPEGLDPVSGGMALVAPVLGRYSGAFFEAVGAQAGVSGEAARALINKTGGAATVAGMFTAPEVAQIAKLPEGPDRDAAVLRLGANASTMLVLGLLGERMKALPDGALKDIARRVAVRRQDGRVYSPEEIRDIYRRVNRADATVTPEEQNLVRTINRELESPGEALRKGATITTGEVRGPSKFWESLGIRAEEGVSAGTSGRQKFTPPEPTDIEPSASQPVESRQIPETSKGAADEGTPTAAPSPAHEHGLQRTIDELTAPKPELVEETPNIQPPATTTEQAKPLATVADVLGEKMRVLDQLEAELKTKEAAAAPVAVEKPAGNETETKPSPATFNPPAPTEIESRAEPVKRRPEVFLNKPSATPKPQTVAELIDAKPEDVLAVSMSTPDAIKVGSGASPEQILALKTAEEQLKAEYEKARSGPETMEMFERIQSIGHKRQMVSEALDEALGLTARKTESQNWTEERAAAYQKATQAMTVPPTQSKELPNNDTKPASAAIRDKATGEVWHGQPTHGLLRDQIPGIENRDLEAGFATASGRFITQEESEQMTGIASGEELFEMTPDEVRSAFESRREVTTYDSDLTPEERAKRISDLNEQESLALKFKREQKATPTSPPPSVPRQYPSYTSEELRAAVDDPAIDATTKARMRAEIEARKTGASTVRVTPQIVPTPRNERRGLLPTSARERYTVLDAVKEHGTIGGPAFDDVVSGLKSGKTASQIASPFGGEYDALHPVIEDIAEVVRKRGANPFALKPLRAAYDRAGFGGNRKGVDRTFSSMTAARGQGFVPEGGMPESVDDLIARAWHEARTPAADSPEVRRNKFTNAATQPDDTAGLVEISPKSLHRGNVFHVRGPGLSEHPVTVNHSNADGTVDVEMSGGPLQGVHTLYGENLWVMKNRGDANALAEASAREHGVTHVQPATQAEQQQRRAEDVRIVLQAEAQLRRWADYPSGVSLRPVGRNARGLEGRASGGNVRAAGGILSPAVHAQLEKLLGVRIIFVETADGKPVPFNGVFPMPGRNVLLVDARADVSPLAVIGHEFSHFIESANPGLYQEMMNKLIPLMQNAPEFRAWLERRGYGPEMERNPQRTMQIELAGNFWGDNFAEPSFWEQMAQQEPTLFNRLARALVNWLNKIIAKFKDTKGYESGPFFRDVQKARNVVADILARWAKGDRGMDAENARGAEMSRKEADELFSFDAPESVAGQKAREKIERQRSEVRGQKDKMLARADARLTGADVDTTQEMFGAEVKQDKAGQGSLFSRKTGTPMRANAETQEIEERALREEPGNPEMWHLTNEQVQGRIRELASRADDLTDGERAELSDLTAEWRERNRKLTPPKKSAELNREAAPAQETSGVSDQTAEAANSRRQQPARTPFQAEATNLASALLERADSWDAELERIDRFNTTMPDWGHDSEATLAHTQATAFKRAAERIQHGDDPQTVLNSLQAEAREADDYARRTGVGKAGESVGAPGTGSHTRLMNERRADGLAYAAETLNDLVQQFGPGRQGVLFSKKGQLQTQIDAAERELRAAIHNIMLEPGARQGSKKQAFAARDAAAARLRQLIVQQLAEMRDTNVDAVRTPEQTAELIRQTVDLLNDVQDDIAGRNARSEAVPPDYTKLQQDLRTRLQILKGWADDATEAAAAGGRRVPGKVSPDLRQKFMEVESATDPARQTWGERLDKLRQIGRIVASPVPEVPLFGEASEKAANFTRGFRLFTTETNRVRKEAAERVKQVLEPLAALRVRDQNAALKEYYRLGTQLQRKRAAGKDAEANAIADRMAKIEAASLDKDPFNLFRKMIVYRDLYWRAVTLRTPQGKPITLPNNLTIEEVQAELARLTKTIDAHPNQAQIIEALQRHYRLVDDLQKSIIEHGEIIPEAMKNPLYFPHHLIENWTGSIDEVRPSTEADFRKYLIDPKGSSKLLQADYIKAMYVHTADVMAHNARTDLVTKYWQPYDISKKLKEEFGEDWDKPWNIPPTHRLYAPFNKIPLRMDYIIDRETLAKKLGVLFNDGDMKARFAEAGAKLDITPDDLRQAMVAGEKIKWVLPREIADALDGITRREAAERNPGLLAATAGVGLQKFNGFWKRVKLFAPWNWVRYEYGNTLTDIVDKLIVADPQFGAKIPQAAREIWAAGQPDAKPSEAFKAAAREGVFDTVTAAEAGELQRLPAFDEFLTKGEAAAKKVRNAAEFGMRGSRFRESVFRYAKFLTDVERMQAGKDPVYSGAFHADIEALNQIGDQPGPMTGQDLIYAKAAEISLKTFGDYNNVSVLSQTLRRYIIPFHSWTDVNFRYHANQLRNIADGLRYGKEGARKTALKYAAARVLATLFGVALLKELWNAFGPGDDKDELEKNLSAADRRRAHVVIGKDNNGQTLVVYTPSAFSDFTEWMGGPNLKRLMMEYFRGQITLRQAVADYAKQVPADTLNKLVQGSGPAGKAGYELASGKSTFPDITDQRSIPKSEKYWRLAGTLADDRVVNFARSYMDRDYMGQPINEQLQQVILQVRRRDPEQWAYYEAREDAADWKEKKTGKRFEAGSYDAPEAQALRNFRRAIYRADMDNALKAYESLILYGYTAARMEASVRSQEPLSDLNQGERAEYLQTLTLNQQREMQLANQYYRRFQTLEGQGKYLFPKTPDPTVQANTNALRMMIQSESTNAIR